MHPRSEPYGLFGTLRITRELNRGATAVVYEAEETCCCSTSSSATDSCTSTRALKVINVRPDGNYTIPISTVQQEIACASRLDHPNVAKLENVVCHGSECRLGLAFELVRGPDLLEFIKRYGNRLPPTVGGSGLPEQLAFHYFRQMVSAMEHVHARGVVHRDLKPENCMIDLETSTLKVIDFGLAALPETRCLTGCGTIYTIAPECIAVDNVPTVIDNPKAVDLWGMGVCLYIMLSGRYPFQNYQRGIGDDESQRRNILEGRINPLPSRVSNAARDLLQKLLKIDPDERMTLAEVQRHPALTILPPSDDALAEQRRLFSEFGSLGSRSSSCTSLSSSSSSSVLRSVQMQSCLSSQRLSQSLDSVLSSRIWRMDPGSPIEPCKETASLASPILCNRSFGGMSTMQTSQSWNNSPSRLGSSYGTSFSRLNSGNVNRSWQSLNSGMTESRSNASLDLIQAALQDATDQAYEEASNARCGFDDDDADTDFASEFDCGDRRRIDWAQSSFHLPITPSRVVTPTMEAQPAKLASLTLPKSSSPGVVSLEASCSLPLSPKDGGTAQNRPVRLFSISEADISARDSSSSSESGVGLRNPSNSYRQSLNYKPELEQVPEVPEDGDSSEEERKARDNLGRENLGIASLSFRSDDTTYEL